MGAGVVTEDAAPFRAMVETRAPAMLEVAVACRDRILRAMPGAVEVVWAQQGTAGYGSGPRKSIDQFAWLLPAAKHVSIAFPDGSALPDPAGRLEGSGAKVRHVKVRTAGDLDDPALDALLAAAIGLVADRVSG